jgi:hypothetical protein
MTTISDHQPVPGEDEPLRDPVDQDGHRADPGQGSSNSQEEKPPTSAKQIAANQRNAKKSTGPRSDSGKARSAFNAMTHGVYAQAHPIERGVLAEEEEEVEDFIDGLIDDLDPRDTQELAVARRIAEGELRLARADRYESVGLSAAGRLTKSQVDQGWGKDKEYLDVSLSFSRARSLLSGSTKPSDNMCWYDVAELLWGSVDQKKVKRSQPVDDGTLSFDDIWREHVINVIIPRHWTSIEGAIDHLANGSNLYSDEYFKIAGKAEESAVEKALAPGGVMDRASILRSRTRRDLERDRATYENLRQRDLGWEHDDEEA